MAESIEKIEDFSFKPGQVASRELNRKFGRAEDYAELHVLSVSDQVLNSNFNFINYTTPSEATGQDGLISEINMDPVLELNNLGYTSGKFKIKLNLLRRKILNSPISIFSVKEISPSRQELRLRIRPVFNNSETLASIRNFINEVEVNVFFKDFGLNFMQGEVTTAINIALDERGRHPELLIKLLNPLSTNYVVDDECNIVEEIIDPTVLTIDLGRPQDEDTSIPLRGPNFKIDTRLNSSIPSTFKTYDEILNSSTVLSASYNELLSNLEEDDVLNIDYDFIRTVTGSNEGDPQEEVYHFENFVHFGSALERLKNFEYKLKLIELYDVDLGSLNAITGPTSASSFTITAKNDIITKKDNLIKGFDGYEKFLYFTSGSLYTWPKQNTSKPYVLYSISSSQAKTWLGDERSSYPNYGGQLLSASLFDRQNQNNLERIIPNHVLDNPDNEQYKLFANMVGQHFDNVWTHIKHITKIPDTHHTRGISRDLVYFTLKSLGVEAFDQFENSNLIEYVLGQGTTGSAFYDVPSQQTLVTASNEGSLPKQDLSKEIWKRLYHNAPHLLKTKGTERGIRALMSCYGIPATILNVKEYGGPVKDRTGYKTFSYEKSGLALRGDSGTDGFFIKTPWSSSLADTYFTLAQQQKKAIEFRIKPHRLETNQHLFSLSGSTFGGTHFMQHDQSLILVPYTGNDISSSNDASQYGKLQYHNAGNVIVETDNFPIFNGDFWNIYINASRNENDATPANTSSIDFGAYQANFNKNVFKYTTSSVVHPAANTWAASWGQNQQGAKFVYLGGIPANAHSFYDDIDGLKYSGSLQEVRYYFGENLTDDTLTKHALEPFMYAGNTISSSFTNVVLRLPLGSNDQQDSSSFHPNIDVKYLGLIQSSMTTQLWEEVVETHHHPTPDTVGASMTSEKVRTDEGTVDDNILSLKVKSEVSALDRQPQDFEDLGVFFSPTTEINEDIVYQLGAFRLDDYIGSPLPSVQTSSKYEDLRTIRDEYYKRVKSRYNYWDYVKLIQYIDHTLFKLVEQFVPAKANLKTGLLIEPHYLERNKFARELPVVDYGTTMTEGSYQTFDFQIDPERAFAIDSSVGGGNVVTTNNFLRTTGSNSQRQEQGTNFTIDIDDYILDEKQNIAQSPIRPFNSTGLASGYIENGDYLDNDEVELVHLQDHLESGGVGTGVTLASDGSVTFTVSSSNSFYQDITPALENGVRYVARATITNYVGTDLIGFSTQGTATNKEGTRSRGSNGEVNFTFESNGDPLRLVSISTAGGTISNISVKKQHTNFTSWVNNDSNTDSSIDKSASYTSIPGGVKIEMFGDPTVTFHPRIYQFLQAASTYAKLKTNTNFKLKFEARKSSTMTMHGTIAKTNDLESLFSPTNLFTTFGQPETEFTSYDIDFTTTDYTSESSPLVLQFRALAANSTSGSFEIRNVSISEVLHDPGKPPGYISNTSNILLGNAPKAKKSSIYYRAKEFTNIQT